MKKTKEYDGHSIDYNLGLSYYGDVELYKQQLLSFETLTLESAVQALQDAWREGDMKTMEKESRRLRGAGG